MGQAGPLTALRTLRLFRVSREMGVPMVELDGRFHLERYFHRTWWDMIFGKVLILNSHLCNYKSYKVLICGFLLPSTKQNGRMAVLDVVAQ